MKKILLILLFHVSSFIYPSNLEGILDIKNDTVKVGGSYDFELILVPYEFEEIENFRDLEGKTFINFFYISNISKIERSENNSSAVVIKGSLILIKEPGKNKFYITSHRDLNFPVTIKNKNIVNDIKKENDKNLTMYQFPEIKDAWYFVYRYHLLIAIFIVGLLVILIAYRFRSTPKVNVEKQIFELKKIATFNELVEIYDNRKSLLEKYPNHTDTIGTLLETIETCVYSNNKSDKDFANINMTIDIIKRSSDGV